MLLHVLLTALLATSIYGQKCSPTGFQCLNASSYTWCYDDQLFNMSCLSTETCGATYPPCARTTLPSPTPYQYNCVRSSNPRDLCPSNQPPGGLASSQVPQFIMLTWDDAITPTAHEVVEKVLTSEFQNPNGCPIKTTWFANFVHSVPELVKRYVDTGNELACHTSTHAADPEIDEIYGCKSQFEGLFLNDRNKTVEVVGFRTPDLRFTPRTFEALTQTGYLYDISIPEQAGSPFSPTPSTKVWPYSLHSGIATNCHTGLCDYTKKYPGLWSIPMYTLDRLTPDENGFYMYESGSRLRSRPYGVMDLPFNSDQLDEIYLGNFLAHYRGNRAPFGMYFHPAFLLQRESHVTWLRNFIQKLLSDYPDVWFIGGRDLIDYMKNPTSASTYNISCDTANFPFNPRRPGPISGTPARLPGSKPNTTRTPSQSRTQSRSTASGPSALVFLFFSLAICLII